MKADDVKPIVEYSGMREFQDSKKLEFCQNSRYLAVYGDYQIQVIEMFNSKTKGPTLIDDYQLDREQFKAIMDI